MASLIALHGCSAFSLMNPMAPHVGGSVGNTPTSGSCLDSCGNDPQCTAGCNEPVGGGSSNIPPIR